MGRRDPPGLPQGPRQACAEGRSRLLRQPPAGLRRQRQEAGIPEHRARHHPPVGPVQPGRADHAADVQGIPNGHSHARGARHPGPRADLPGTLRLGLGRLPCRRSDPGRPRPDALRLPEQHRRPRRSQGRTQDPDRQGGRTDPPGAAEHRVRRGGGHHPRVRVRRHRRRRGGRRRLHQGTRRRPVQRARRARAGGPRGPGARRHHPERPEPADLHLPRQGTAVLHRDPGRPGDPDGGDRLRLLPDPPAQADQSHPGDPHGRGGRRFPRRVPLLPRAGLQPGGQLPERQPGLPRLDPGWPAVHQGPVLPEGLHPHLQLHPARRAQGQARTDPPAVLRQDHPGRHAHPAPTGGRGPGGAAEVPAAAVPDLNALSAWMCFSNFLNHLSLDRIEADYANIL